MIKLYNGAKVPVEGLIQYQDLKIEEEQDQLNVVSFTVPKEEAELLEHEGYVEVKDNGRYVIKEKNYDDDDQVYEIVGLYDLEELQGYIESAAYISLPLTEMMDILLAGTGWTFVTNDITIRTATGVTIDRLDFIYAIVRDTFGLEIKFDNQARIIFADEMLGEDKGVYFSDEVNLTALTVDSDSYDFATRIIPRGKDGLSIEAINGGLPYLENLTYSSKVITKYWSDERYTVLENLKAEGQKKLDAISKPLMSYSAKAQDLYTTHTEEFGHLEYNVSDTITLINKETNTKEKQRIVKRVKYPDVPEDDTVTIANRIRSFISESQQDFDGVKQDFSVIRASLQLLAESVEAKVSQNVYDADKEAMDQAYAQVVLDIDGLEAEVLNMDGDIANLQLDADGLRLDLGNMKYGGQNLFLTSGYFESAISNWFDNGGGLVVDTEQKWQGYNTLRTIVGSGIQGGWYALEKDIEYTFSALIKSDQAFVGSESAPLHYHAGLNNTNQGKIQIIKASVEYKPEDVGKFKLLYITFKLTEDADSFKPFVYWGTGNRVFNIAYLKLESGNIPTDMSPGPGELKGESFSFTRSGFQIGGASGDVANHTRSESVYQHTDGSYTRVSAEGLNRMVGSTGKRYKYLTHLGTYSKTGSGYTASEYISSIYLPSEFDNIPVEDIKVIAWFVDAYQDVNGGSIKRLQVICLPGTSGSQRRLTLTYNASFDLSFPWAITIGYIVIA